MPEKRTVRQPRRGTVGPIPGQHQVKFGLAELLADADRPGGWLLTVDNVPQSYVQLDDPTYLEFEYVRRMGDVVDALAPADAPLEAVHIGGGACTLPRYISAKRPGSRHLVIEADGQLADLVREQLALRSVPKLRVRVGDGLVEVTTLRDASTDLFVLDAFEQAVMPSGFGAREFVAQADRVLRPTGVYLANLAAGMFLLAGRQAVATVTEVFPHVVLLADPQVVRGRREGNLVVAASRSPLPVDALTTRIAGAPFPVRLLNGEELHRFVS